MKAIFNYVNGVDFGYSESWNKSETMKCVQKIRTWNANVKLQH
jgi:hypothetical protein